MQKILYPEHAIRIPYVLQGMVPGPGPNRGGRVCANGLHPMQKNTISLIFCFCKLSRSSESIAKKYDKADMRAVAAGASQRKVMSWQSGNGCPAGALPPWGTAPRSGNLAIYVFGICCAAWCRLAPCTAPRGAVLLVLRRNVSELLLPGARSSTFHGWAPPSMFWGWEFWLRVRRGTVALASSLGA